MPLRFVDIQHGAHLGVQGGVQPPKPLRDIHMYRRFAHAEFLGGGSHGGTVCHDIFGQFNGPLLN